MEEALLVHEADLGVGGLAQPPHLLIQDDADAIGEQLRGKL